ncbi:cytoplasmic dynein 2 light intermediate chain 1-like [Daphnia pulicaria]|uniref:cytoplasmic dynein 2 light intermediate chain 1-like n=1 Tax=Daphnia pulicaria TaxID=35523 RepID=UPI001EEAAB77|nr:cytoplasmic dynein 2 light intermediate chain 1-like [Daphnia pulicaria]
MNKSEELWNIVVKEGLNNYNNRKEQPELQTLFLVGTPKSGKTTLIHAFLDKDDEPKASLPVEYTYIRRTNKHMVKDICYIWEVDITNITFVSQLTKSEGLEKISLLLVIDLLHVQDLWNAFETVESFKKNMEAETKTIVNFGIIGMKYDLFEDLTTEKKLILCRITKHYATILDGHLIFCAKKDRTTLKVAKDLFSHLAFTTKFSHQLRFDLSSPIIIPRGGENKSEINYLHHTFETQFAHKPIVTKRDDDDPAEDLNYTNDVIDKRREKCLEESGKP